MTETVIIRDPDPDVLLVDDAPGPAGRSITVHWDTEAPAPAEGDVGDLWVVEGATSPPALHAATHGDAGSDPVTVAQSQVTDLGTDLAARIPASIVDAKGDLIAATAADAVARVAVGAAGSRLVATPAATAGVDWVAERVVPAVGDYWATHSYVAAAAVTTNMGTGRFWPIAVPRAMTVSELGVYANAAGAAGGVWRLGVYAHDPATGLPGALMVDVGAVDPTTIGFKLVTGLSLVLPAGIVWACLVVEGTGGGGGSTHSGPSVPITVAGSFTLASGGYQQGQAAGITAGGLPSPAPAFTAYSANQPPVLWLRRSA